MTDPNMTFGALRLSSKMIEKAEETGIDINISVAGFLYVDADVTPEMIRDHVGGVFVNGMILGSQKAKDILREKEAACAVVPGKKKTESADLS